MSVFRNTTLIFEGTDVKMPRIYLWLFVSCWNRNQRKRLKSTVPDKLHLKLFKEYFDALTLVYSSSNGAALISGREFIRETWKGAYQKQGDNRRQTIVAGFFLQGRQGCAPLRQFAPADNFCPSLKFGPKTIA